MQTEVEERFGIDQTTVSRTVLLRAKRDQTKVAQRRRWNYSARLAKKEN
jgi:hypothetical protein